MDSPDISLEEEDFVASQRGTRSRRGGRGQRGRGGERGTSSERGGAHGQRRVREDDEDMLARERVMRRRR